MPPVHDTPEESNESEASEPFSLPLLRCGSAGPRLSRIPGLSDRPERGKDRIKRIVKPPIKLADWALVEAAEAKATEVLSRDGNKPTRQQIGELTYLILQDLEK